MLGASCRWDNNGNIHDHHLQPTMALLLHQSPIRMLTEVYMGLDLLVSADASGMLAIWESATCHCKVSKNIPELREAVSVLASQLSGSGAALCCLGSPMSCCWLIVVLSYVRITLCFDVPVNSTRTVSLLLYHRFKAPIMPFPS